MNIFVLCTVSLKMKIYQVMIRFNVYLAQTGPKLGDITSLIYLNCYSDAGEYKKIITQTDWLDFNF